MGAPMMQGHAGPMPKNFIQLIDEYGIRFSVPRQSIVFYRDEGELRTIRYHDYSKHSAMGPNVIEIKVKTTYEDLVKELA
jgi:hypothetical protein